jgi:hypothetical protein
VRENGELLAGVLAGVIGERGGEEREI